MKKTMMTWLLVFLLAAALLFMIPVSYEIERSHEALVVYEDPTIPNAACTVSIAGEYKRYIYGRDTYDGVVSINEMPVSGGSLRFTFENETSATWFSSDGVKGCVRLEPDGKALVITACYDPEQGAVTGDKAYACTIYAPAESEADIPAILELSDWLEME